jgi:ATP-dependent Clp protease ATP-binding subunit ClpA
MIQRYILNELSREMLSGKLDGKSKVVVDVENDEIVFRYE